MKKLLLTLWMMALLGLLQNQAEAQRLGFSGGYGTSSSMLLDAYYLENGQEFHIGFSRQFAFTRGKPVEERDPNYATTVDGIGEYFRTFDFGYGYHLKNNLTVNGEVSLGSLKKFTNYLDPSFTGGGYHMFDESNFIAGFGANIGYRFTESINAFLGYNTLRKITFGLRVNFPFPNNVLGEEESEE